MGTGMVHFRPPDVPLNVNSPHNPSQVLYQNMCHTRNRDTTANIARRRQILTVYRRNQFSSSVTCRRDIIWVVERSQTPL